MHFFAEHEFAVLAHGKSVITPRGSLTVDAASDLKQNLASWIQLPTYMKLVGSPDPVNVGQNSCSKAEGDDLLTHTYKEFGSAKHVRCATLRHIPDSATRTFLAGLTCHTCGDSVPGFQIGRGKKLLAGGPYRSATWTVNSTLRF